MSAPYYQDDHVTLHHGDCREVLPRLLDDAAQLVLADPPYGIGKADWDDSFHCDWMTEAARVAPILGLMPGTWNILSCPREAGRLRYRWTLAAHLVNGMTRGATGYSNWIPCLVYSAADPVAWCAEFADWCDGQGVTKRDLDAAAGTSDMGGWWLSRLPHRAAIPTPEQWAKLRAAFDPPWRLWAAVNAAARVYRQASDAQRVVVGRDDKPDHPSPKPLGVMRWLVDRLSFEGDLIIDPFAGSGSTLLAARELGRHVIGIETEERYCELIAGRLAQDVLIFGNAAS
jgi:hypothetical protein